MRPRSVFGAALLSVAAASCASVGAPARGGGPLLHHVYFDLREDDAASCRAFADRCRSALGGLADVASLTVATRAEEFDRDVNDRDFDVAVVLTFADRAAHDRYQVSPEHQALVAASMPEVAGIRVFDAWAVE